MYVSKGDPWQKQPIDVTLTKRPVLPI